MKKIISEADIEQSVMCILKDLDYKIIHGDNENYQPRGCYALRSDYSEVILIKNLKKALQKINPSVSKESIDDAVKQILRNESQKLIVDNKKFHKMLVNGIDVTERLDNEETYEKIQLFDFVNIKNNEFLAINQFTVKENDVERRPDIVLFVNGMPLLIIELKNLADEKADIWTAYNQLQTYKEQIPSLFRFNEILVVSDGIEARTGTISSEKERFMQWKTVDGKKSKNNLMEIEILLHGICDKQRFLDIIQNFIVFENDKVETKKLAAYHQYWATNKALASTICARKGNKKAGIVWHTQGSGKSLTMIFYSGKLVKELDNPTLVVLTDRNDLDHQLFGTFGRCQEILRQKPKQAESRKELQKILKIASGGIIFTTIQKFFPDKDKEKYPLLSERDNIVVIADEAHRSQYGFSAKIIDKKDKALITYGYAKYLRDALPNASFIGFTGTPIENADRSTPAIFGKYVDTYDIKQAVEDGSTVKIYYHNRLVKLGLNSEERKEIDKEFTDITAGEAMEDTEKLKNKWVKMEKVVGSPKRIQTIAKDIVEHFEKRLEIVDGKGMIVCMSRRICIALHNEIIKLRPKWCNEDDEKGLIKVVITGSASDPKHWQEHIRNTKRRKDIGNSFKDATTDLKLLIVCDMFLTGYDAPSLHTMYLDKIMQSHTLMQAIARVNRIYPGKEGGLIVDYIGIGRELENALQDYTISGGKGKTTFNQDEAIRVMQEKYEIVKNMFYNFDYEKFFQLEPSKKVFFIHDAMEHILKEKGKKERFIKEVSDLLKAFSLSVPSDDALKIQDCVGLFQAIKSSIVKITQTNRKRKIEQIDLGIKQILSKAIISDNVIDIFESIGKQKPDISIFSEKFLEDIKKIPQKNLAIEALRRLLNDNIKTIRKKNIIKGKSFMEMLEKTIKKYTSKNIETVQIINELIELAKTIRNENQRSKQLGMTEEELAFYDALEVNDSAVKILGDKTLRQITLELIKMIKHNVTIDWTQKESVRAILRVETRKILRKYGYPPDKDRKASKLVVQQAEIIAKNWAEKR